MEQEKESDELTDDPPPANGLYCFFDSGRECGPDCMSFTKEPSEGKSLSSQQKNCVLLVSVDRLSRYMGMGATTLSKMHMAEADRRRATPSGPPDPLKGTR